MEKFTGSIYQFYDEIDIKCPKCSGKASVSKIKDASCENCKGEVCFTRRLKCNHCLFFKIGVEKNYIISGKHYCSHCFEKSEIEPKKFSERPKTIKHRCSHCKIIEDVKPSVTETVFKYVPETRLQTDPFFGCELWFQKTITNHLFFAFNQEHIEYLMRYIGSNNRVRVGMNYVARLPQFVKDAKNRNKLLKVLEKWRV